MLIDKLKEIWDKDNKPFFIGKNKSFSFKDLKEIEIQGLKSIKRGDVVALIGDFDPESIITFLMLLDMGMIVVPLTEETSKQHSYFFQESKTQYVFKKNKLVRELKWQNFGLFEEKCHFYTY